MTLTTSIWVVASRVIYIVTSDLADSLNSVVWIRVVLLLYRRYTVLSLAFRAFVRILSVLFRYGLV